MSSESTDTSTRFGRRQAAAVPTLSTDNDSKDDNGSSNVKGGRRAFPTDNNSLTNEGKTNGPSSGWGDTNTSGPVFANTSQRSGNSNIVGNDNYTTNNNSSSSSRHKFIQESVTEVVAVIRDTDQETMEDLASKVAAAPRNNTRRVQSLAELDNDTFSSFTSSSSSNNQPTKSMDLSLLTASLCSPELLIENDEVWEFDRLLQSLSQQMTADAEKKEGEDVSVNVTAKN